MIDILEQEISDISEDLFDVLLKDRTTKKNICWATDHYKSRGSSYYPQEPITKNLVTGNNTRIVQPRVFKSISEQAKRTKDKAEVFTPSWVCNEQNNLIDEAWFEKKEIFNREVGKKWITNYLKIEFEKKAWQDYVKSTRLEISCGEAPYLVSRYDTVTGKKIKIEDRIGLLDRKLRIVTENNYNKEEWVEWSIKAIKSIYGFDWQGDNVLLSRENILYTYIDYYYNKFNEKPDIKLIKKVAKVISWNIWQMDGIKYVIPNSEVHSRIMNWDTNRKVKFEKLLKNK